MSRHTSRVSGASDSPARRRVRRLVGAALAIALLPVAGRAVDFRRGDANTDGAVDLSDSVLTLGHLFLGSPSRLACDDAADSNDDGVVDITDAIHALAHLFLGGPPPPFPGDACGADPTGDALDCDEYPACGHPTPPSVVVTPLEIDFGPVGVGQTSAQQTITITNLGPGRLDSFAGGAPGNDQFIAAQSCAGGVEPGESCEYLVRFRPTEPGLARGVSTTGTSAGPLVMRFRGTGIAPSMTVSQTSLDFGRLAVGQTSAPQTVTIRNTGLSRLEDFAGGASPDPQFQGAQSCAAGVEPGESCEYTYRFTPAASGTSETVAGPSTNAGLVRIAMRGVGKGRFDLVHQMFASPLEIDFGPVGVGTVSAPEYVTITNTGLEPLVDFSGGGVGAPFSAAQDCASGVLPGRTCRYTFRFAPTEAGPFEAVSRSGTSAGDIVVRIRGTGVGASAWATPLDIDFGPVRIGTTSEPQYVTVTNTGLAVLAEFSGGGVGAPFSAAQSCASGVDPGASCEYIFRFSPTAPGPVEAVSQSGTNGGPIRVRLRGRGIR